ncbi:hypothetical protein FB567DRAFT_526088 [Paraphoma chrysanthemicola]|uniref:Uncharacterized protein n=1 Tax=Paraphoma chrysanthemicola TaxID=798071 RepID=A0A8K0VYR3_9PLEO|nr:hypothetical protein FB567DRAFT_526088 [Paraphoma chrysanthemicola]
MHTNFIVSFLALAAGIALAAPAPQFGSGSFASGEGNEVFGNVGLECQVGRQVGECDRFGRCTQFIPPNELSVLNQGSPVAECQAGGATGVIDANGDVVRL